MCVCVCMCHRYGGYLGVKYLMAARLDMATVVLPRQMPLLITGLQVSDAYTHTHAHTCNEHYQMHASLVCTSLPVFSCRQVG